MCSCFELGGSTETHPKTPHFSPTSPRHDFCDAPSEDCSARVCAHVYCFCGVLCGRPVALAKTRGRTASSGGKVGVASRKAGTKPHRRFHPRHNPEQPSDERATATVHKLPDQISDERVATALFTMDHPHFLITTFSMHIVREVLWKMMAFDRV